MRGAGSVGHVDFLEPFLDDGAGLAKAVWERRGGADMLAAAAVVVVGEGELWVGEGGLEGFRQESLQ